jgi:hypothetical protein
MDEGKRSEGELAEELRQLGRKLGEWVKEAVESEEGRQWRQEIIRGLQEMAEEINKAAVAIKSSPATQDVVRQVQEVVRTASSSKVAHELRDSLVDALRNLSQEVSKVLQGVEGKEKTGSPPEEPPSTP